MFNLDKVQDAIVKLTGTLEENRKKTLRSNIASNLLARIVDITMQDADLVATAKVSVKLADILLKELGETK